MTDQYKFNTIVSFNLPVPLAKALSMFKYDTRAASRSAVVVQALTEFLTQRGYWPEEPHAT